MLSSISSYSPSIEASFLLNFFLIFLVRKFLIINFLVKGIIKINPNVSLKKPGIIKSKAAKILNNKIQNTMQYVIELPLTDLI